MHNDYIYMQDDDVIEGESVRDRRYIEEDFNRGIEIKDARRSASKSS
jgi:hypothetical protein